MPLFAKPTSEARSMFRAVAEPLEANTLIAVRACEQGRAAATKGA